MASRIPDALEQFGIHRAAVTWFDNAVKVGKNRVLALGYCGYGRGIAFISCYNPNEPITQEWLKLIIIRDVLYGRWHGEDGCDDAKWCVNLKCPYNRAEVKHFKKYGLRSIEDLKKLHAFLEDCCQKLKLASQGSVIVAYKKPPLVLKRVR